MKYRSSSIRLCLQAIIVGGLFLSLTGCESSTFSRSDAEPPMNRHYMELYRTTEIMDRPPPQIYRYPRPPVS
ncbi:hypothetical protein [Photobacterium gaetbulicola]|uniref:hypothetical protein n=1 Tax=Photobacterium gaetbulicola TaxID=1295392 RepID=UPI000AF33AF6|nr:hypothetical protein [Photobacterium gaetbulicola]